MYKINRTAKRWEREMFFKSKNIEKEHPYDLYHLYIELEKISKKYMALHEMEDGDKYIVPIKDGSYLTLTFYKDSTSIIRKNINGSEDIIIMKEDGSDKEKKALIALSNTYLNAKSGIGEKYPEELKKLLIEVKTGDIISFSDSKNMYVCNGVFNNGDAKTFQKLHSSPFHGSIKEFTAYHSASVIISNDQSVQNFYDENRDLYSSRSEVRIFTDYMAQEWINRVISTTKKDTSTKVDFAGLVFIAQKQNDNSLVWYDSTKTAVPEETIKLLYAWFQTSPVERKIESPEKHAYDDVLFLNALEEKYKDADFQGAFSLIKDKCKDKGLVFRERSYIQTSDTEFKARSFAFYLNP